MKCGVDLLDFVGCGVLVSSELVGSDIEIYCFGGYF